MLQLNPNKDELGGMNIRLWVAVTISWVVVYICIRKGVEQTGKIALFTVLSPYILLFIFLIRVLMLDGFGLGLKYLLYPDFSKLFTFEIWKDAMVQVAFQLSIGQAVMPTFSSFRKPTDKLVLPSKWYKILIKDPNSQQSDRNSSICDYLWLSRLLLSKVWKRYQRTSNWWKRVGFYHYPSLSFNDVYAQSMGFHILLDFDFDRNRQPVWITGGDNLFC